MADRPTLCAACGREIPERYVATAVVTAAGPVHPGCARRLAGRAPVGEWST